MKILLADDHPLFLEGLSNLLTARGLEVVGTARDGLDALEQARMLHPDLILMDVNMPGVDGLAATRLIKAEMPDAKIVVLTMSADDEYLFDAIKSGACGYLLKSQETDEFFAQLSDAARGEIVLSPGLAARIVQEFASERASQPAVAKGEPVEALSFRQRQVLTLVAQGLAYKEVGAKLFLTERTIKYHMGEIVQRLQMENRAQVIEYARRTGLIR
jgi:two-component system NarL family response regulator